MSFKSLMSKLSGHESLNSCGWCTKSTIINFHTNLFVFLQDEFLYSWIHLHPCRVCRIECRSSPSFFMRSLTSYSWVSLMNSLWTNKFRNSLASAWTVFKLNSQGPVSIKRCRLTGNGISMLKIIFNMGIPIPGKDGLYIETGPWLL